jgi:transglutaminase-like putative cysteine protease
MKQSWMKSAEAMVPTSGKALVALSLAVTMFAGTACKASDTFQKPTPEELAMTSVPGFPGASAVVLFREETTNDDLHSIQRYERIKILTEEGKQYANVELRAYRTSGYDSDYGSNEEAVQDIQGRTIHPDGTIIPFTGKPYEKTLVKSKGGKVLAKVFTLPDVEVGSIIEYRYSKRFSDSYVEDPQWYIQGDLYVKAAHYVWHPTSHDLVDSEQRPINTIAWFPLLPAGVSVKHTELPGGRGQMYELNVKDIPPAVNEDYMPPMKSYTYRVLFSFTAFRTQDEFWKAQGKQWSKHADAFMKQNGDLKTATDAAIAGATTPEEKLKKIYAKVMSLENTDYTRERERTETGKVNTVSDVLSLGRGSSTQLTYLFVAMAREAGLKSYLMLTPDRSENFFVPSWLSMEQLGDVIAIVNIDGKDTMYDPGSRYCAFGHLAWQHMFSSGLRQVDGGTAFAQTNGDGYATNRSTRVANLTMDEHGQLTGKIDLNFTGAEALRWRHVALRGDEQSLKDQLREMLESRIPHSLEVKVSSITGVDQYEQPLKVSYEVTGTLGTATGKRLVMPADLFESNSVATFSQDKRETAVDLHYPQVIQDALRINFAKGFELEAAPKNDQYQLAKRALYSESVESNPKYFVTRRAFTMGEMLFEQKEYPELKTFYSQVQTKDKESVVLKMVPVTVTSQNGGN